MWFLIFAFQLLLYFVAAVGDVIQLEAIDAVPESWEYVRRAAPTDTVILRISLKQQNLDTFYDHLLDISTPDHPRYGQHYEGHEIQSMLHPSEDTRNLAFDWLESHNITTITDDDGHYIQFRTDVETANDLLNCEFSWYVNTKGDLQILRTMNYSIPKTLEGHINFIQPTTYFPNIPQRYLNKRSVQKRNEYTKPKKPTSGVKPVHVDDPTCNFTVTPECVFNLYNIHYRGNAHNGNSLAIASFLEIYTQYADLLQFQEVFAPYMKGENFTVVELEGGLNVQGSQGETDEGNLDMQYAMGIGFPTPCTEYSTGGRAPFVPDLDNPPDVPFNEPYLPWAQDVLKMPNDKIPKVISISYNDNEQTVPVAYAQQVCNLFAQFGARGVSIITVAGDFGVGHNCKSNDGRNQSTFIPQFPASCPYVTVVGGTVGVNPEIGAYISAGGFSNIFPRPKYQDAAVLPFLASVKGKNVGLFNPNGRGIPDVAAQSLNVSFVDKGVVGTTNGTSLGAPIWCGLIALLNSARINQKKPTLGFLNPWIYANGHNMLTDITRGQEIGCNGQAKFMHGPDGSTVVPNDGWNATVGWDPVTGMGTPNFGDMLESSTPGVPNTGGIVPFPNGKLTW